MKRTTPLILLLFALAAMPAVAQGLYPEIPPGYEARRLAIWLLTDVDASTIGDGGATFRYLVNTDGSIEGVRTTRSTDTDRADMMAERLADYRMAPARYFGHRVRIEQETSIRYEQSATGVDVWIDDEKAELSRTDLTPETDVPSDGLTTNPTPIVTPDRPAFLDFESLAASLEVPQMRSGDYARGKVTVRLLVEPDGSYLAPIHLHSTHPMLTRPVFELLNGGTAEPGMVDGRPVRSILEFAIDVEMITDGGKSEPYVTIDRFAFIDEAEIEFAEFVSMDEISFASEASDRSGEYPEFIADVSLATYDPEILASNVERPALAVENDMEGRVICTVYIEADGTVSRVEIVEGDRIFHDAARAAILATPFTPATQNGMAVPFRLRVPVHFTAE